MSYCPAIEHRNDEAMALVYPWYERRLSSSPVDRQISRGVVAIYKDYTGRGPTNALTTISDLCSTTLLHDALTKAERKLVEEGDYEMVRALRRRFQDVMGDDICAPRGKGDPAHASDLPERSSPD